MGLIIEGLFALCLVLVVLWLLSLRGSFTRDQREAQERQKEEQRQEQESAARAEREARLLRPGEPLRCLGCEYSFAGPLLDTGCPQCHLSALVVPAGEARAERQTPQTIGFRRKDE